MSERGFLGGRGIDLALLDAPVRRVIFTTYAVLLGLALAVALRDVMGGKPWMADPGIPIPPAVGWIAALGAAASLTLLLAGAAHARTRWRYLLVAPVLLAAAIAAVSDIGAFIARRPAGEAAVVLATPFLFMAGCIAVVIAGPRMQTRIVLAVMTALIGASAVAAMVISATVWPTFGPSALFLLLGVASMALEPALMVVGWDLAEIGVDASAFGLERVRTRRHGRIVGIAVLAAALAAAAALEAGLGYRTGEALWLLAIWTVLLALCAIAAGVAVVRWPGAGHAEHRRTGYLKVLGLAIALIVPGVIMLLADEPDPAFFNHDGNHLFSVTLPPGFKEVAALRSPPAGEASQRAPSRLLFRRPGQVLPTISVAAYPRPPFAAPEDMPRSLNPIVAGSSLTTMPLTVGAPDAKGWMAGDGWTVTHRGTALRFYVFERDDDTPNIGTDLDWFVACGDRDAKATATLALCQSVKDSFRADLRTRASRGAAVVVDAGCWAAALGAFVLAAWRRRCGAATPGLDFVAWTMLLNAVRNTGGFLFGGVDAPFYDNRLSVMLVSALLIAVAACGVMLELAPARWARKLDLDAARSLVTRNAAALTVLSGLFVLYVFIADRSEHSQAIRGVIVCLALTWELVTAGAMLNPAAERHAFPRSSRVLIFVGYLILVATCVFMFGKTTLWSGTMVAAYDTEGYVANGIVLLGGGLIVSRALAELSALRPPAPVPAPLVEEPPLAALPVKGRRKAAAKGAVSRPAKPRKPRAPRKPKPPQ